MATERLKPMKSNASIAVSDVMRPKSARFPGAGVYVSEPLVSRVDHSVGSKSGANDEISGGLGQAIEAKQRDNLVLGEALVSFGLLERRELSEVQRAQALSDDVVGSLMIASAIRTRLGDILLHAKRITSSQLELALETQRRLGGRLGEILVAMGALDRGTLDAALALQGDCELES
jgi:hypothetical protein